METVGLAGVPTGPIFIPHVVGAMAAGDAITPVWRNALGGLTFRLGGKWGTRYMKWAPPGADLTAEAQRLVWAQHWVAVPRVLGRGTERDGSWLVTEAVPGESAVAQRWVAEPATAAAAIGHGLRVLHDTLPVAACPFEWCVEERIAAADRRIADGATPADWFPEHRGLDLAEARARLDRIPDVDRAVVCHGDPCAPNTLLNDDGTFAAHVDLGSMGVADRWADLAVASWSLEWNYGPGHDETFFAAYGIAPDPARIAYYRLLWDMS